MTIIAHQLPPPRKALVVRSLHSGKAEQLGRALLQLKLAGIEIEDVLSIASLDGQPAQGAHWLERGIDIAIAAGGDGLVGGVTSHIAQAGPPLGILPLGTSNDVARSLAIPQDIQKAIAVFTQGQCVEIDIGTAQPAEQAPLARPHSHHAALQLGYFAHALTLGLNVQFARLATTATIRQRFGRISYPLAALNALKNHQAIEGELRFKGLFTPSTPSQLQEGAATSSVLRCRTLQITVINAPLFGGMWQLPIPGASLHDQLLDIVIIEDIDLERVNTAIAGFFNRQSSARQFAPQLPSALQAAELAGIPGLYHFRTSAVDITTDYDPQDVTLDGELRGQTPIHIAIADTPVRVFVPLSYPFPE